MSRGAEPRDLLRLDGSDSALFAPQIIKSGVGAPEPRGGSQGRLGGWGGAASGEPHGPRRTRVVPRPEQARGPRCPRCGRPRGQGVRGGREGPGPAPRGPRFSAPSSPRCSVWELTGSLWPANLGAGVTRAAGCLGLHPVSSHPRAPRSESRNCPEQPGRWTGRRGHCGDGAGAARGSRPAPSPAPRPCTPATPVPRTQVRGGLPGQPSPPASWSSASERPHSSGVPGPPSSGPRKPRPLGRPCWDEASTRGDAGRAQADPPVSVRVPSGSLQ